MFSNLFEYADEVKEEEKNNYFVSEKLKSELTPRQWRLYEFLKAHNGVKMTQKELLDSFDYEMNVRCLDNCTYGYFEELVQNPERHFSNMTSARWLRDDLKALRMSDIVQKVLVQGKIANTKEEALAYLESKKAKALGELKLYWKELRKLEKHFQMRFADGKQRDYIEALLPLEVIENELPF